MKSFQSTALLAVVAPLVSAHYNFDALIVDGVKTEPYQYVRALAPEAGNGPFYDVTDNDIRCNKGSFANAANTETLPVKAGDTLGFNINSVLGHPGPLFAYMSKSTTPDITTYEGDGDWFKIYEIGVHTFATYNSATTWVSEGWTEFNFTIPAEIEDGQYLLRAEHIAIHSSGPDEGSQFYLGCAQIEVSGGVAGAKPSPVGKFPGIYTATDPGILFDQHWPPLVNYTVPGIEVYPEGGSVPDFTASPDGPAQTQPLPATYGNAGQATSATQAASTPSASVSVSASVNGTSPQMVKPAAGSSTSSGPALITSTPAQQPSSEGESACGITTVYV